MTDYVSRTATLSSCGTYRYSLTREWRLTDTPRNHWRWLGARGGNGEELGWPKACVFIMLNPSTADGKQDDPTIRRCVAFAQRFKFDKLVVLNLFAYRATNPRALLALNHNDNPAGVDNQSAFKKALPDAGLVVAAWGAHGPHLGQDETVRGWIDQCSDLPVHCLGKTKDGHPRHPLYLPSDAILSRMSS